MTALLRKGSDHTSVWLIPIACVLGLASAVGVTVAGPVPVIGLMTVMLLACAAVALPGALFAAYLLIPFYKAALQPYSPVDLTVLLALANTLQIVPWVLEGRTRSVSRIGIALWTGVGALVAAGALYAPDQNLAFGTALTFWVLVLLPVLAGALRVGSEPRYIHEFLWTFFGMGVLTVVLGLASLSGTDRLTILGMDTIQVSRAALLVPLIGVAFVLAGARPSLRLLTVLLIPGAIVVALASGSRGPLIVFVLLAAIAGVRSVVTPRGLRMRTIGIAAGVIAASFVVVVLVLPLLPASSTNRFVIFGEFVELALSGDRGASATDTSAGARVRLLGQAVSMFEDRPILGAGTAGFQALSPSFLGPTDADRYPHNALLQFAAEYGLVGVVAFVGIILIALFRRLPQAPIWSTVRVLFAFLLVNSMLTENVLDDRMMWGFLMLVLLADVAPVLQKRVLHSPWATQPGGVSRGPA